MMRHRPEDWLLVPEPRSDWRKRRASLAEAARIVLLGAVFIALVCGTIFLIDVWGGWL